MLGLISLATCQWLHKLSEGRTGFYSGAGWAELASLPANHPDMNFVPSNGVVVRAT